jgi:hypothetical protein
MPIKQPPEPPEVPRRFRMHRHQIVGLLLIIALPIFAAAGAFGPEQSSTIVKGSEFTTTVWYPTKLPLEANAFVRVQVLNTSSTLIDTLQVMIDTAYLTRFRSVSIMPESKDAGEVELVNILPGEKREVLAEIVASEAGRKDGQVAVSSKQEKGLVNVSTMVYW